MAKSRIIEPINIGPLEIRKRRAIGIIMACFSVILIVILAIFRASEWLSILLIFPYLGMFIGFLQAKNKT